MTVLERVETQDGWASDLLERHSTDISERDAGLATELVFGILRHQTQLDYLIQHFGGRRAETLEPVPRLALRLGLYQLRYMDRIPPHAAVGESVELVKRAGGGASAGLVNAILRKVNRDPVDWPSWEIALDMPEWLLGSWERHFDRVTAEGIAKAASRPPATYVRHPPANSGVELAPTDVEGAWCVVSGSVRGLRIQDIGSQSVVPLLDLRAGQTFLDLCAAPQNKTAQALETDIRTVACDRYLHRLDQRALCPRVVLDATQPLPFRTQFDRVLVDAPCSGTGTLARNPEIRWRLTQADIRELHGRQTLILRQALEHVKPNGRLVYSTCSLEKKENEDVVERVLNKNRGFRLVQDGYRIPGMNEGDGFYTAVIEPVT